MKENLRFPSRSLAEAFRLRLKKINAGAFTSCYLKGGKYVVLVSGTYTSEQIQQAKNG